MSISAETVLYIKLGEGGKWEQECIEQHHILHLGYNEVPHELCTESSWNRVRDFFVERGSDVGAATRHANQIRLFYESEDDVLWITFFRRRLWWCFSGRQVSHLDDGSKTRPVLHNWNCNDLQGTTLDMSRLSGKLLSLQGFQGTICAVREKEYLLRKINAEIPPEIENAQVARDRLALAIEPLVRNLQWRDFEILVDLIFRQAGWKRVSELG